MSYRICSGVDSKKVCLVKLYDISGRQYPSYYCPLFLRRSEEFDSSKFQRIRLLIPPLSVQNSVVSV